MKSIIVAQGKIVYKGRNILRTSENTPSSEKPPRQPIRRKHLLGKNRAVPLTAIDFLSPVKRQSIR